MKSRVSFHWLLDSILVQETDETLTCGGGGDPLAASLALMVQPLLGVENFRNPAIHLNRLFFKMRVLKNGLLSGFQVRHVVPRLVFVLQRFPMHGTKNRLLGIVTDTAQLLTSQI